MESTETPQQHRGGIFNYFQGATINNLVINGNVTNSGFETTCKANEGTVSSRQIVMALKECQGLFCSMASYAIVYCVCRDLFHFGNTVASFVRGLKMNGIEITEGSINTAMCRNAYMKYHVDKWKENGADNKVLKKRDMFRDKMDEVLALECERDVAM
jgi:hypothetical protein